MYQTESQNVKERWGCELSREYLSKMKWRNYKIPNNEAECKVFQIICLRIKHCYVYYCVFVSCGIVDIKVIKRCDL